MSRVDSMSDADDPVDPGPLEALFSGSARIRVIETFVSERGRDLSVSDVARLSHTSRSSVYRHLDDLLELGIITESRTTGDGYSTRYQLNEENQIAEQLHELEGLVLRQFLELEDNLE